MRKRLHISRLILSSFQYFIIVSIPHSGTVCNTYDDRYSDFDHFLKMWKRLYIETFPHLLILPIFEKMETSLYRNVSTFS